MASGYSFNPQPEQPSANPQAIGRLLMQRGLAMQPQYQTGMNPPMKPGQNQMRGVLPQIGQRLLQSPPSSFEVGGSPTGYTSGGF